MIRWNKYTSKIASVVDTIEQIIDGRRIFVGFELLAFESMPIIDVGKS